MEYEDASIERTTGDLSGYRAGPQQFLRQWRSGKLPCAKCLSPIRGDKAVGRLGGYYHPSHAPPVPRPVQVRAKTPTSPTTPARVLGTIQGVALSFGVPCYIAATGESECFTSGAMDAGLGDQTQLLVNHMGSGLRGQFTVLREDAKELAFRFALLDDACNRDVLRQVRAGAIRGCSVGFRSEVSDYDRRRVLLHRRTRLTEISLCRGSSRPAWYGTFVRAA